ncbi:MAG: hypothetical protein AAF708_16475 [Deinococcota bacterium]
MPEAQFQASWNSRQHRETGAQFATYLQSYLNADRLASDEAQQLLSWAWQLGQLDACVQVARHWLASEQLTEAEVIAVEARVAACLIRLGNLSDAEAGLQRMLSQHSAHSHDKLAEAGYAHLQLGNAQRYLGYSEDAHEAFSKALESAETTRDGGLAIAAHTALGELALDNLQLEQAIESLGKGLGLTEFFRDKRLTIAPLAALAHAHALWKNPNKSYDLVSRALSRAQPSVDRVGSARAKFASATAALTRAPKVPDVAHSFADAYDDASVAPHLPLALRIATSALEQQAQGKHVPGMKLEANKVLEQLQTCNMLPQLAKLSAVIEGS